MPWIASPFSSAQTIIFVLNITLLYDVPLASWRGQAGPKCHLIPMGTPRGAAPASQSEGLQSQERKD